MLPSPNPRLSLPTPISSFLCSSLQFLLSLTYFFHLCSSFFLVSLGQLQLPLLHHTASEVGGARPGMASNGNGLNHLYTAVLSAHYTDGNAVIRADCGRRRSLRTAFEGFSVSCIIRSTVPFIHAKFATPNRSWTRSATANRPMTRFRNWVPLSLS